VVWASPMSSLTCLLVWCFVAAGQRAWQPCARYLVRIRCVDVLRVRLQRHVAWSALRATRDCSRCATMRRRAPPQKVPSFTHTTVALSRTKSATSCVCVRACVRRDTISPSHSRSFWPWLGARSMCNWMAERVALPFQVVIVCHHILFTTYLWW